MENRIGIFGIAAFCMLAYLLGWLFPEPFWATHIVALYRFPVNLLWVLMLVLVLSLDFWWPARTLTSSKLILFSKNKKRLLFGLAAVVMAIIYYRFPIAMDLYGDAFYIKQNLNVTITQWDPRLITELLEPDWLYTKSGLKSFYQLNNLFTWLSGANGIRVLPVLEAVGGGLFVLLWLNFVDRHLTVRGWKWLFAIIGLSSPLGLVFMAHYEAYYLTYIALLGWWSSLGLFIKTQQKRWLYLLPCIFLLVLQTHITLWLLLPSFLLAMAWYVRERLGLIKRHFNWRSLLLYMGIPMLIFGAIAYFFIYANHDGPRQFSKGAFENNPFLPLYTDEPAPYDRYFLQSPAHLLDYFNLLYMWSGATLLLAIPLFTFLRKRILWNEPLVLISGFTALIYVVVFFCLNPLLGLVDDWDLFSIPAWSCWAFLLFAYAQIGKTLPARPFVGPVLAFCLLGGLFIWSNSSATHLARHLHYHSRWHFKTYWIGGSTDLIESAKLGADEAERERRLQAALRDLKPYAVEGNDKEYANVLLETGLFYKKVRKDDRQALAYMTEAYSYAPRLGSNVYHLTITYAENGDWQAAAPYSRQLVEMRYPPFRQTLKIGIHIALETYNYQQAADYAVTYLRRWQDDEVIREVERRLRTGDRIEALVALFGGPPR